MGRVTNLAVAALVTAIPAQAAVPSSYYTAVPKVETTRTSVVTRSTVWKCTAGTCAAPRGSDRDAIACELIVGRVGALSAFTAGGVAWSDEALAKCNARAK